MPDPNVVHLSWCIVSTHTKRIHQMKQSFLSTPQRSFLIIATISMQSDEIVDLVEAGEQVICHGLLLTDK